MVLFVSELGNTISTLFGGGSSEPAPNVTEPVQVSVLSPPSFMSHVQLPPFVVILLITER